MKETLRIKQIKDSYKKDKDQKVIHRRYVEISDAEGTIKVVFNNDFGDLHSKIRNLDENTHLEAEVVVDIDFTLKSRQATIQEFNPLKAKVTLDGTAKENIKKIAEYMDKEDEE